MRFPSVLLGSVLCLILAGCTTNNDNATTTVTVTKTVTMGPSTIPSTAQKPPEIGFSVDNQQRTVTIIKAPTGRELVQWALAGRTCAACDVEVGGTCDSGNGVPDLNGVKLLGDGTEDVKANDIIGPCASGETLTFTHIATGTALRAPITFP